jgi:ferredoxin-NADP reductase
MSSARDYDVEMWPASAADGVEQVRTLQVVARRDVAERVIELEFAAAPGESLPGWQPGAHIDLRLGDDLVRQYSLVPSWNGAATWITTVLVETEGRGGSLALDRDVHPGTVIKSSGPRNHFPFVRGESYLFIAGGIGVTPMIALCRAAESAGADWRLAYLGRERAHLAYVEELSAEFGDHLELHLSSEGNRFDISGAIAATAPETHVYCCGPERLMEAVEESMSGERLPYLHLEHFRPREIVLDQPDEEFTVYAVASDVEFVVPADETILMAADFEGILVPGDCLEGTCGSCETRVLLGEVEHRDSVLTPLARAESKTMMICVSRARHGCSRLELDL